MADYLSRACRLQLTTTMENLIRTAVFEISQIFEDSLHDHQMELSRKGEEIAYLKVKLQRAELSLKEFFTGDEKDLSLNPSYESPGLSEESAPNQSSAGPEVVSEVLDDWCIPVGSENVNNQENSCPSVRLKQFSIPLFPIPLKHEAFREIEIPRLRPRHNQDPAQTGSQEEIKVKRKRGRPHPSGNDKVLMKIKKESFNTEVEPFTRRGGRKSKQRKAKKLKITNIKTKAIPSGNTYGCRLCPKEFSTQFGLSVHERAHKKCNGCKKIFPSPSVLMQHKKNCKYFKKLTESSNVSAKKKVSKGNSSSNKQKDKSSVRVSSVRKIKNFTCKCCLKKFNSRSHLMKHPCFISCRTCHKRLSSRMALAVHITKMHNSRADVGQKIMDTSWTKPLDPIQNSQENSLSTIERGKRLVKKCSEGFKCLICNRVYVSKYTAIEHTFAHTGERPYKCAFCSQTFAQRNALSIHRRKLHGVVVRKHIKCACSKWFYLKSKYKEHRLRCPKVVK